MRRLSRMNWIVLLALFCGTALTGVLAMAGKPSGGDLPPVGPATGVIYFWDVGLDPIVGAPGWPCKINADGSGYQVLPQDKGLGKSAARDNWDVSRTSTPRFFVYRDQVTNVGALTVASEDGLIERPLVSESGEPVFGSIPAISQDGLQLAYRDGGTLEVADLICADDGVPLQLANPVSVAEGVTPFSCTWSPDGTAIAFDQSATTGPSIMDIFVVTLTFDDFGNVTGGSAAYNITNSPNVSELKPAWSPLLPDGTSRIAYRAVGASRNEHPIQTRLPDGSGVLVAVGKVNSGATYNSFPSWSPDGTQLAFAAVSGGGKTAMMRSAADGRTTSFNVTGFSGQMQICRVHWRP